ncbi:hypothetical protein [Sandaracinus amylolyticus]|uniref:Fe-S oxidoreductase n=1 Tax=Sandaracinus amylolyticus TaxID=927083 RepID=A0A0F6SFJ1_9BACT|nr:hypothetical protein [Sandaracinus amylolyticus]AKF07034.1 Fe-S oxidoreductase [Sandaracinus amylolyticus]
MRDDLQRRISAALDAPGGIDGDPGLRELLDGDPQAAAYAHDVARLGRLMREWPLPEPDDAAFEALASRIEQRLDETLPRGVDVTGAPQFDDDDDLRDATAGLLGPVITSGEFQVEELESIPPVAPVVVAKATGAPPPPPSARPVAPPVAREIPKLAPASDQASDRLSFPSIPPAPGASSLQQAPVVPLRKRGRYQWLAGLAAAAAVGLGVFTSTQIYQDAPGAERAAVPAQTVAPAATPTVAPEEAAYAALAEEAAPAPITPMPAAPMQRRAEPIGAPQAAPPPPPRPGAAAAAAEGYALDGPHGMLGGALASGGAPADEAPVRARARRALASDDAYARGGAGGAGAPASVSEAPATTATARADQGAAARSAPRAQVAAAPAEAELDADLPATPDRGAVLAAIQAVEPAVRACAEAEHGVASVRIVVAGTGRVTTATVGGQFAGTPVGSCVARAVRTARFPRFASERFEVTYPFQL